LGSSSSSSASALRISVSIGLFMRPPSLEHQSSL
jgi:hypothetical protein